MNWRENDLKIVEMREKILKLTDEFNEKKGKNISNYNQKLNNFLDRRLRKESNLIFAEQIYMTISPLNVVLNS